MAMSDCCEVDKFFPHVSSLLYDFILSQAFFTVLTPVPSNPPLLPGFGLAFHPALESSTSVQPMCFEFSVSIQLTENNPTSIIRSAFMNDKSLEAYFINEANGVSLEVRLTIINWLDTVLPTNIYCRRSPLLTSSFAPKTTILISSLAISLLLQHQLQWACYLHCPILAFSWPRTVSFIVLMPSHVLLMRPTSFQSRWDLLSLSQTRNYFSGCRWPSLMT